VLLDFGNLLSQQMTEPALWLQVFVNGSELGPVNIQSVAAIFHFIEREDACLYGKPTYFNG
jgi:hypothetical protein